ITAKLLVERAANRDPRLPLHVRVDSIQRRLDALDWNVRPRRLPPRVIGGGVVTKDFKHEPVWRRGRGDQRSVPAIACASTVVEFWVCAERGRQDEVAPFGLYLDAGGDAVELDVAQVVAVPEEVVLARAWRRA